MDTNYNLTAAKASIFFRKRTIISQLRQQVQTQILKEGPVLISSLLPHKHLRGFLPSTIAEVHIASLHLLVNKLLKLKAWVNVTNFNETKLFPCTNQHIYFSD